MSSKKPKPQATPTLAGLAVTWPDGERCVYPWTQVQVLSGQGGSRCWLHEPDGTRLRSDTRIPVVRLPDQHVAELCRRAQRRYIRNSWRSGTLRLAQCYDRAEAVVCGSISVLLLLFFSWMGLGVLPAIQRDFQLPGHIWIFTLAAAAAVTLMFCAGPLWLGLPLIFRRCSVRRAVWTSRGIEAELNNGHTQSAEWSCFDRVTTPGLNMVLHFRNGTRLRFAGGPRSALTLIRAIECELMPGLEARQDEKLRAGLKRAAIWWGVGGVIIAVVAGSMRGIAIGVLVGLDMLAIAALFYLRFVWLRKQRKKRWHRRQRKASALQSNP